MPMVRKKENAVCRTAAEGTGDCKSCIVACMFGFGAISICNAKAEEGAIDFGEFAFAAVQAEKS
jgi:hypothetical protein